MRKSSPPLLAIFRTRLQGELLALIYLSKWESAVSISDVARILDQPVPTVHREVVRLLDAGLLKSTRSGRTRLLLMPDDNELVTRPLRDLLAVTFGPLPVLRDEFSAITPVPAAFIYGSWAARYDGVPGPTPNDVDVLVVSDDIDLDDLDDLAIRARKVLRREVNVRKVRRSRWDNPGSDPFMASVRQRALVPLTHNARELIGEH